jgi:hypothetical protein
MIWSQWCFQWCISLQITQVPYWTWKLNHTECSIQTDKTEPDALVSAIPEPRTDFQQFDYMHMIIRYHCTARLRCSIFLSRARLIWLSEITVQQGSVYNFWCWVYGFSSIWETWELRKEHWTWELIRDASKNWSMSIIQVIYSIWWQHVNIIISSGCIKKLVHVSELEQNHCWSGCISDT